MKSPLKKIFSMCPGRDPTTFSSFVPNAKYSHVVWSVLYACTGTGRYIHRWMAPHSDDVKKLKYFRPSIVLPSTVVIMLKCMRVAFYWSGKMLSSILTRIFNLLSHVFSSLSLRFLPSTYIIIYIHRALLEVHAIPGPI